jgi:ACT domain-containing protein
MKKINKQHLKILERMIKKAGIEPDLIDIQAIYDRNLSWSENKHIFQEILRSGGRVKDTKESQKDYIEAKQQEANELEENNARKELIKSIKMIKSQKTPEIDKYFKIPIGYIKTTLKSDKIHSFVWISETGLGKDFNTIKTLENLNYSYQRNDYIIVSGHITPLDLYQEILYRYKDKIIVFSDLMSLFDNPICKGLLLSAFWSPTDKRIVNYFSSSERLKVPKSFEFTGKGIFLSNDYPDGFESFKERSFFYDMKFSYNDKLKIIYELCKIYQIDYAVADFIKKYTNKAYTLNFRTPLKLWEIYRQNQNNGWKQLALNQLNGKRELLILNEILEKKVSTKEKIAEWVERTGMSRATYYRYLQKFVSCETKNRIG